MVESSQQEGAHLLDRVVHLLVVVVADDWDQVEDRHGMRGIRGWRQSVRRDDHGSCRKEWMGQDENSSLLLVLHQAMWEGAALLQ